MNRPLTNTTILDALDDPHLFGRFFREPATWAAWRVLLMVLFGLALDSEQLQLFQRCTGRQHSAPGGYREAWLIIGRRGGKSFILALIAVFLACFKDWQQYLAPGERATIMVVACDRRQSRIIMRYIRALISGTPMLAAMVENETQESIDLNNRISIEVHVCSYRSTRGYAVAVALLDELAFWPTDENSAEPDREIINAIRPGMASIRGSVLLCASSPYARKGELWNAYQRHFGKDSATLAWQADTTTMNPTIDPQVIAEAAERDPACAAAEYGAQFRVDLEQFINRDAAAACVTSGVFERAPLGNISYSAFVDPSGGSVDSMTLAIGHFEADREVVVIDLLKEIRAPLSPEQTCAEFSDDLRRYNITEAVGDRYAGQWPVEQFSRFGINYLPCAKVKSDLYLDVLSLINSHRIELLDHPRCFAQLIGLERRTARGGRDRIDHPPGAHDDLINAVSGVASGLIMQGTYDLDALAGTADRENDANAFQRARFAARLFALSGGQCWPE